ncbi:MAG: DUF4111 domain-containing protein [Thermomicrobia bacterium]|nr:DUF4111 domain-containing protein [Thermomicrobia bacterium]
MTHGDTISKSAACRYALERFPERWNTVVAEALALRAGTSPSRRSRVERRRDVLDFMEFVIDSANGSCSISRPWQNA